MIVDLKACSPDATHHVKCMQFLTLCHPRTGRLRPRWSPVVELMELDIAATVKSDPSSKNEKEKAMWCYNRIQTRSMSELPCDQVGMRQTA